MIYRVDVRARAGFPDKASEAVFEALRERGLPVQSAGLYRVYLFEGEGKLPVEEVASAAHTLLADPVCEDAELKDAAKITSKGTLVLVFKKPGVMDPVEGSAVKAFADLGMRLRHFRAGQMIELRTTAAPDEIRRAIFKTIANEAVDEVHVGDRAFASLAVGAPARFEKRVVPVRGRSDEELAALSRGMALSLDAGEMRAIRVRFEELGRDPTDVEVETLAQTWSEHCKHKTFTADVEYDGERIPNLLKSTVMRATREIAHPDCLSVFQDNAGVVAFDDETALCIKVETHNHPSAIEPYGGANTGVGGVIRDVMGCGLGAKPIASVDVFAVGHPTARDEKLPAGTLHPKRLLKSVVAGVRDYGNRMGIPTVAGAVVFDDRYVANPLVYCGTVGILPRWAVEKGARPGDLVVVVGGRTGRDGIHGATFSSAELDSTSETVSSGAVQIGNAIVEKRVLDSILEARDSKLYTCITDCGAGGLSSAVGETAEAIGAEVELDKVPLKYEGLTYAEIWISEAQERMVLAVPPENWERLRAVCDLYGAEATPIGRYADHKRLVLRYRGEIVMDLEMEFIHHGLPRAVRRAARPKREERKAEKVDVDVEKTLLAMLAHPDVASKEWIVRQYDHEVQGGSVVKPFCGPGRDGPSDAAVVRPRLGSTRVAAIGMGLQPWYADLSPYQMAACGIDEAVRNVVAVGGDPRRTFLLDNFCWASPRDPEVLGALVEASRACYEIAKAYGTPFVSGKDSLNNEFRTAEGRVIRIPHTLLVTALSIFDGPCVTMDLKAKGSRLLLVGETRDELGAGLLERIERRPMGVVPTVDAPKGRAVFEAVHRAIASGRVRACHDLSEGGLAVALAEMAFAGGLGVEAEVESVEALFSETPSRFLLEVDGELKLDVPHVEIGRVTGSDRLAVRGLVDVPLARLKAAWKGTLAW
jgi:phosphoribosylformylglycinamidine synthase II